MKIPIRQEAQMSQRNRATLRVIEYFAKSLKITQGYCRNIATNAKRTLAVFVKSSSNGIWYQQTRLPVLPDSEISMVLLSRLVRQYKLLYNSQWPK